MASMEDGLDKEGQEVLSELEKEGFDIAGREKPGDDKPAGEEGKPETEPEKPKVEGEGAEPEKPEADTGKPEGEEGKSEDKTEDKGDEGKKPEKREAQYVPLSKYLQAETDLKAALAKLEGKDGGESGKPTQQQVDVAKDAVQKLVELGYDEDEAKKVAAVIQAVVPGQALPPEVQEKLSQLDTLLATQKAATEAVKFDEDFNKSVLKEFPHLDKYKDEIKAKAYTEQYAGTPLRTIALEFMHDEGIAFKPGPAKTVEKGGGGTERQVTEVDFENITDEQFAKLSPEDQDKFFAYQEAKEKKARGALN